MLGGKYKSDWQACLDEDVRDKAIPSYCIYAIIYWSQSVSIRVEHLSVLMF